MLQSNFTQNEILFDENYIFLNLEVLIDLILQRTKSVPCVSADSLKVFTTAQRVSLFIANLIIFSIATIGNVAVIVVNAPRKMRCMYKYCLASLALSDLIMTIFMGIEHLSTLSEEILIWHLGEFMCKFIPFIEIAALIVNSMTLTTIAIDRYQTIVNAFQFKWNPKPFTCYLSIFAMWIVSVGIASPLLPSYRYIELEVFEEECDYESGNKTYIFYNVHRCMGSSKRKQAYYFGFLLIFIFLPLLITFLWLYSHVALLIWKRTRIPKPTDDRLVESSTTDTTNIGTVDCRKQLPNNNCITNNCRIHTHQNVFVMNKQSLERKLRTFKVILILMCVFFICRLPTWLFMVIKQSMLLNKNIHWYIGYGLNLIAYSNSAFNPFLYTFLNETIVYGQKICSLKWFFCCFPWSKTTGKESQSNDNFAANNNDNRFNQNENIFQNNLNFVPNKI